MAERVGRHELGMVGTGGESVWEERGKVDLELEDAGRWRSK